MSADRWNEALEAAAKACEKLADKYRLSTTHRTDDLVAAAMMCSQAILALREADQRGAAATCTEGASPETGESQNRASDGKLEAQSAPHHPGGREEVYRSLLVSMLSAQDDVRAYLESIMPEGAVDDIMLPMDACADVVKALLSASAKVDPGVQEKAVPTALVSSDPEGHLQAMSDAELPAPVSPGPDHETLIVERLRSIHAELLAAAEEERSRG